ncbi:methylated-DNA--[protein]-cysteine S-methyltransferase [Haloactinopolyspora alba]|nr:methylated-DNA--[protein]-cysteine S-methyltransferase [Haloactinopolyspora alba]
MTTSNDVALGGLDTPVGHITVAVTSTGLARVSWARRHVAGAALPAAGDQARVRAVTTQLAAYFRGELRAFDLPLDWRFVSGTARVVLQTLHATVGYGRSVTYGELAERSGTSVPARGIGAVMGSNPLPVVVPCHRVLAHDGLGGYSGGDGTNGLEVKRWLLTLEGVLPPTFDWSPDHL